MHFMRQPPTLPTITRNQNRTSSIAGSGHRAAFIPGKRQNQQKSQVTPLSRMCSVISSNFTPSMPDFSVARHAWFSERNHR